MPPTKAMPPMATTILSSHDPSNLSRVRNNQAEQQRRGQHLRHDKCQTPRSPDLEESEQHLECDPWICQARVASQKLTPLRPAHDPHHSKGDACASNKAEPGARITEPGDCQRFPTVFGLRGNPTRLLQCRNTLAQITAVATMTPPNRPLMPPTRHARSFGNLAFHGSNL